MQAPPTLSLVNDYIRFVVGSFEVISTSARHIYHSAISVSPQTSIVRELYKQYIHPLARVVRGLPISWGPNFATVTDHWVGAAVWSSCSRFIAVETSENTEVLDGVTLEQLHTFKHPWSRGGWSSLSPDGRSLTRINYRENRPTTWDLQTGGQISATPLALDPPPLSHHSSARRSYFSSTHSMDGKIVAFAYRDLDNNAVTGIATYNLISGTHVYYSHHASEGRIIAPIWTHGELLRFAAVKPGSITIWEVGFTSEHALAEIESLPAPDDTGSREHLFLPTPSRLAFTLDKSVLIWDARDSKILLNFVGSGPLGGLSFSSDGRFFACGSDTQGVHLWKESPTGYVLHQKLVSGSADDWIRPFLSPDGESIITSKGSVTQLWHTTGPIDPPPSVPLQPVNQIDFVLAFSPDKSFIATGRWGGDTAIIVDLKSGDLRLMIDTGMVVCGLGVTGSTAIVVGEGKIVTWNLPAGDRVLNAEANIHDSVQTIVFDHPPPPPGRLLLASISPDFNHLAITREEHGEGGVDIYDASTGKHLFGIPTDFVTHPWFTRDGREVWCDDGEQKIIMGGGSDVIRAEPVGYGDAPPGGHLWESAHGHEITDDGWILDSRKRRVMWMPHHWRVSKEYRIWDGRFLVFFDGELPEPVIIEMYE